jgi:hypothetical protein
LIGPYHLAQFFRVELASERSRVDQVTKQYGELTPFGVWELRFEGWDSKLAISWGQCDGLFQGLRGCRNGWWYGAGIACPDQASAFFINDLRVRKEDSFFEVLQVSLIQGKLPHHSPI